MPRTEDPTREELIALCEQGFVGETNWHNRDSAKAMMQLGEAYALLKAGCEFRILRGDETNNDPRAGHQKRGDMSWKGMASDKNTWWVQFFVQGFDFHENGGPEFNDGYDFRQEETAYIPTALRLKKRGIGEDWY